MDKNIPRVTVGALRAMGHDVRDVRGTHGEGMLNLFLWELAQKEGSLLITTDKYFARHRHEAHHGIPIVRLRQPNRERVMRTMAQFGSDQWPGISVVMRLARGVVAGRLKLISSKVYWGHARALPVVLLVLAISLRAQVPNLPEKRYEILRLRPTAFPELPKNLVRELQRRRCTVPQHAGTKKRDNVIRGEFAQPGQTDWAVVCSQGGYSTILVFWNGSEQNPAHIARTEDPDGKALFLRQIRPVGRKFIMDHYRAYGGSKPPPIDHQGIDESIFEVASVLHYYYRGKWLRLTGAD